MEVVVFLEMKSNISSCTKEYYQIKSEKGWVDALYLVHKKTKEVRISTFKQANKMIEDRQFIRELKKAVDKFNQKIIDEMEKRV